VSVCFALAKYMVVKITHSGSEMVFVRPPSRNDGVNQDHVEGFSVKREFTSTCIQAIIIVF
jgi:hypothetical protein